MTIRTSQEARDRNHLLLGHPVDAVIFDDELASLAVLLDFASEARTKKETTASKILGRMSTAAYLATKRLRDGIEVDLSSFSRADRQLVGRYQRLRLAAERLREHEVKLKAMHSRISKDARARPPGASHA